MDLWSLIKNTGLAVYRTLDFQSYFVNTKKRQVLYSVVT